MRPPPSRTRSSTSPRARSRCASPAARPRRPRSGAASIATFRRDGFLNFVYFTDSENLDPQAVHCVRRAHRAEPTAVTSTARRAPATAARRSSSSPATRSRGPLHTNDDSLLLCGSPGLRPQKLGPQVERTGRGVRRRARAKPNGSAAAATPTINTPTGKFSVNSDTMNMPTSNERAVDVADSGGTVYTGKTIMRLKTDDDGRDQLRHRLARSRTTNVAWPLNGVLYVKNNGACNGEIPTAAKYTESDSCGNVYVSGTYSSSMTIAAANDVIIRPTLGGLLSDRSADSDIEPGDGSDATLGLIANNFVRVGHKVKRERRTASATSTPPRSRWSRNISHRRRDHVPAALLHGRQLRVRHAWARSPSTARSRRSTVARSAPARGAHDRRRASSRTTGTTTACATGGPPYFLNPLDAAWDVLQLPRAGPGS